MKVSPGATAGLFLCIICILFTAGCSDPQGNIEDGKRWYSMYHCNTCHGKNGNDGKAEAIAGIGMGYGRFVRYVRNPSSPSMPKFDEKKLPKQDAADIYLWLKSLPE